MKKTTTFVVLFLLGGVLFLNAQVLILPNFVSSKVFSNKNDIWSTFPQGVVNYEAQVMYIFGEIYVASQMPDSANHTLPKFRDAFLMPIYSQYKKNNGKVQESFDGEMFIIIDIKYDAKKTYLKLWEQLKPYNEMLTYRNGNEWRDGKLKIVFVGNAPMSLFQRERVCFVTTQGTPADIVKKYDSKMMPLIGIDFSKDVEWNGIGTIPFEEYTRIKGIVKSAHDQGKKVRVYNCPEDDKIWEYLITAGVDLISASDADLFSKFMAARKKD